MSPRPSAISCDIASSLAPIHGRSTLRPFAALSAIDAHQVRRDRKADADRAARLRVDHRVDADQAAGHVDERAAGIARIDGGVGLDENLAIGFRDLRCAPAPRRCRWSRSGRRRTGCRWPAPGRRPRGVSESSNCKIGEMAVAAFDLQHGDVGFLVLRDDLGVELALVGERHADFGLAARP